MNNNINNLTFESYQHVDVHVNMLNDYKWPKNAPVYFFFLYIKNPSVIITMLETAVGKSLKIFP